MLPNFIFVGHLGLLQGHDVITVYNVPKLFVSIYNGYMANPNGNPGYPTRNASREARWILVPFGDTVRGFAKNCFPKIRVYYGTWKWVGGWVQVGGFPKKSLDGGGWVG